MDHAPRSAQDMTYLLADVEHGCAFPSAVAGSPTAQTFLDLDSERLARSRPAGLVTIRQARAGQQG
jgi:hypothetical protein